MRLAYSWPKNYLRENILYEVVSSFMLPGIYCIIMTHKLRGGNSHNIPACDQAEFWADDDVNNDHEQFAMTMTIVTTLLVKSMKL